LRQVNSGKGEGGKEEEEEEEEGTIFIPKKCLIQLFKILLLTV